MRKPNLWPPGEHEGDVFSSGFYRCGGWMDSCRRRSTKHCETAAGGRNIMVLAHGVRFPSTDRESVCLLLFPRVCIAAAWARYGLGVSHRKEGPTAATDREARAQANKAAARPAKQTARHRPWTSSRGRPSEDSSSARSRTSRTRFVPACRHRHVPSRPSSVRRLSECPRPASGHVSSNSTPSGCSATWRTWIARRWRQ